MGRAGRGGGGMRGGGGRMGGGLGGGRVSSGRGLGSTGSAGRAGRGLGSSLGGGAARAPVSRAPVSRTPVRTPMSRPGSFGLGVATGMALGGGRRRSRWGPSWGWGGGWGRRRHTTVVVPGGGGGGGGGCGCFTMILGVFILIIGIAILGSLFNFGMPGSGQVTRSTVEREALPRNAADSSVPLLVDHLGWIGNQTVLNRGLNNFHDRTGVRPILYLTGSINGVTHPTDAQLAAYAEEKYTELTKGNEAHVLFLFFENAQGEYAMWVVPGNQALTVIDGEARDIMMDYVSRYYYGTLDEDAMFSRAFDEASTAIMRVYRSPWITVLVVAGVLLILFLLYTWWKAKKEQKNKEDEQTERILSQPLEEFGSGGDEASRLAKQYEDDANKPN